MDAAGPVPAAREVILLYPSAELRGQLEHWARRHPECVVTPVYERTAQGIGRAAERVEAAVIDASQDHEQAIDAFSWVLTRVGSRATSVYTTEMHEGVERFVRSHGALLLFGPLSDEQWEDHLHRAMRSDPRRRGRLAA